jgi:hypothetical protein
MNKQKWIALIGLILGGVATTMLASPLGANPGVHTACDLALKLLAGFGLIAPVSLMGGQTSTAPKLPLPPPGSSTRVLLPLAFLALTMSGCANLDWHKFGVDESQCLTAPVEGALTDTSNDLVDAVNKEIAGGIGFDSKAWADDAKALGLKYGFAAVACAAEHLIGDLMIAGPEQVCKLKHKQAKPEHLAYLRKLLPKR